MHDRIFQPMLGGLHGEPKPAAFTCLRLFQVLGRPPPWAARTAALGSSSPLGVSGGSVIEKPATGKFISGEMLARCRQKLGHQIAFAVNRQHLGLPNNADGRELAQSLVGDGRDDGFLTSLLLAIGVDRERALSVCGGEPLLIGPAEDLAVLVGARLVAARVDDLQHAVGRNPSD
jgi:hypothetical protein